MRRWGLIVTASYALIVVFLLVPGAVVVAGGDYLETIEGLFDAETLFVEDGWIGWLILTAVIAAQALLFFVSVDMSFRRLKPRTHVALSIGVVAFAVGLLCFSAGLSVALAIAGDDLDDGAWLWLGVPVGLWLLWSIVFYIYRQRVSSRLDRIVGWLLNGSVLQLLIAVPCHLIVRHRNDCSAPAFTGFGIATGVALMLMAFGPSVVFLYQKKLGEYGYANGPAPMLARWPVRTVVATLVLGGMTLFLLLPYEGPATHGGSIDDTSGVVDEVVAAVQAHAEAHGMRVREARESLWIIECDGNVVMNLLVIEDRDSAAIRVSYQTYSEPFLFWDDYMRFAESIDELLGQFGEPLGISLERPPFPDRFRGQLFEGTLFGGGCRWPQH